MADRIAVMNEGNVLQVGAPDDIYERPTSRFVADFIGETNFLSGTLQQATGTSGRVELTGGHRLDAVLRDPAMASGEAVTVAIRPEKLSIVSDESVEGHSSQPGVTELEGTVVEALYIGTDTRYHVRVGPDIVLVVRAQNQHYGFEGMRRVGEAVRVSWHNEHASILA